VYAFVACVLLVVQFQLMMKALVMISSVLITGIICEA